MNDLHQPDTVTNRKFFLSDNGILLLLALVKLSVHFITNALGGYGYFRDELYYLACSDHMAFGYVDQPPFSIALLWISRICFGDSLFALRLLPAFAGAATVFLAGLMARELGGNRFAQVLAAVAVIVAPIYLGMNNIFSMNSFEVLFWTVSLYLLTLILNRNKMGLWIWLGVALGLGLLNKISVLWLCAGIFFGLLFTPARKHLRSKWFWFAVIIAAFLFHPYIIWQFYNDWPTLEFMKNAAMNKYADRSSVKFLIEQILMMHPLTFPIWITGLIALLFSKPVRQFRALGIVYLTVFLILLLDVTSKAEYLAAAYPVLLAAGAVVISGFIIRWQWLKPVILGIILISGIAIAPVVLPILPVETYIVYAKKIGQAPSTSEKKELGKLPQFYADMFGWENMAATVARVYNTLPPEDQAACTVFGQDYGQAGAIDFFGKKYHLPKAISRHNNYWLWGPGEKKCDVLIVIGGNEQTLRQHFETVDIADTIKSEYVMPYENNLPVMVCRHLKFPADELWEKIKLYN